MAKKQRKFGDVAGRAATGGPGGPGQAAGSGSESARPAPTSRAAANRAARSTGPTAPTLPDSGEIRLPSTSPGASAPGARPSASPSGTARAGRRERARIPAERPFFERYRSAIIGVGGLVVVAAIAAFFLLGATQPAYACSIQLDPAPSPSPGASIVGQQEDDQGRTHVALGTNVTYTYCPPASGRHFNVVGQGPIQPRFYGPDETTVPMGWIHNLEHGGMVVLYNCARNGCDTQSLDTLKALATNLPDSPVCGLKAGQISPVITRFDEMKAPFAAVVWNRVLFLNTADVSAIEQFYKNVAETTNPEQQCSSSMIPSAAPSSAASASPSPSGT